MEIALIGNGAIAGYVKRALSDRDHHIAALLLRPERVAQWDGPELAVETVAALPSRVTHVIDCAGHGGLRAFGAQVLRSGRGLTTVSIGALADQSLQDDLRAAGVAGKSKLCLASGAIGALDCLDAGRVGRLSRVRYVGRKPPSGWLGSPAEERLDLKALTGPAQTHFTGSAREAAIAYPKNANVAAAVALAGIGFDETQVELVADPAQSSNVHEIFAEGAFGEFHFQIAGKPLASNPRSSALAAMSIVAAVERQTSVISF